MMGEPSQHARLSASAAERWMNCPGSAREIVFYPRSTSAQAAEGTYAHELAAECLTEGDDAGQYLGRADKVDGHDVVCDAEMVEGVNFYLETIRSRETEEDFAYIEMPLLEALAKLHPDLGGTADYVRCRTSTANILVMDFKYGAGVLVNAVENKQAKVYALGALLATDFPAKTITVGICQPRIEHPEGRYREWTFEAREIVEFAAELVAAAEAANDPNAPLVPGYWCKKSFCPAARDWPVWISTW
jgi:hypothetical protein